MKFIKFRFIVYSIVVLLSLVIIEVLSISIYAFNDIALRGKSILDFKENMFKRYSRIYSPAYLGDFDPVTQMQFPSNFNTGVFKTNEFGFISNGSVEPLANEFPLKNEETIRIIMLGGSTMVGYGVDSNTKTIPAILERIINSNYEEGLQKQKYVQVLNFGHPGAHSSIELAKLSQYLVHLEPDVVISLDGYNDAWYSLFEHNRQTGKFPHGVINWADYSYAYYNILSGGSTITGASFGLVSYLLPTTSSLFANVYNKLKMFSSDNLYLKMIDFPPFKLSSFIKTRDGDFAEGLLTNYAAMGGLACAKGFAFWGFLQPHALENYQFLTKSEKDKISLWEDGYGDYTGGLTGYDNKISELYDKYEAGLLNLNTKFSYCPNVNFISLRNILSYPHVTDLYVDNIHYTEEANKQLANEMAALLNDSLSNLARKILVGMNK
jgi:hypothetical protein